MKKIITVVAVLVVLASISYSIHCRHEIKTKSAELEFCYDILDARSKLLFSQENLLHRIYQDNPIDWENYVMNTEEYIALDNARDGDWEDFYYYWD